MLMTNGLQLYIFWKPQIKWLIHNMENFLLITIFTEKTYLYTFEKQKDKHF